MMDGMSLDDDAFISGDDERVAKYLDVEIEPPITVDRKPFSVLHLEEPTGRMMEKAEQELAPGPNAYTLRRFQITLVAQAAKVPREVVERMRVSDVTRAFDFLATLLPGGQPTGET